GSAAQIKAMKQVASSLKIELANYRELQAFSQFGSDLDADTKRILNHGRVLMEVLKQKQYDTYPVDHQIIEFFAVKHGYLETVEIKDIHELLEKLYQHIVSSHQEIIDEIYETKVLSEANEKALKNVCEKFFEAYK
ncbi:MAG: F0F1 ATP synthase subunit alpha, partial [Bacilli bacterium]|nr:F0F1 ATP synthase subunit alpha [Bacilli bacterium]